MEDARDAVESVARASHGRLIAYLSVRSKDIAIAEDALSEAFATALRTWPASGIPDRPEAWLLTTAPCGGMAIDNKSKRRNLSYLLAVDSAQIPCSPGSSLVYDSIFEPARRRPFINEKLFLRCNGQLDGHFNDVSATYALVVITAPQRREDRP